MRALARGGQLRDARVASRPSPPTPTPPPRADLTSINEFEEYVGASEVVVVFLAGSIRNGSEYSDYFHSANCLRELRRAHALERPLVFVLETDPLHGGISLEAHRRDCPPDLLPLLPSCVGDPSRHLVLWLRVGAFRTVSLRQILQVVLQSERPDDTLYVPGEILQSRIRLPQLFGAEGGPTYHLYVSDHNDGAAALAGMLAAEAEVAAETAEKGAVADQSRLLRTTREPADARRAMAFLLYLSDALFNAPTAAAALQEELVEALSSGMPLLLVHEQRHHGKHVPIAFSEVIGRTPPPLREAGLYGTMAVSIYDDAEQARVGLRRLLRNLEQLAPPDDSRRDAHVHGHPLGAAGSLCQRRTGALWRRLVHGTAGRRMPDSELPALLEEHGYAHTAPNRVPYPRADVNVNTPSAKV